MDIVKSVTENLKQLIDGTGKDAQKIYDELDQFVLEITPEIESATRLSLSDEVDRETHQNSLQILKETAILIATRSTSSFVRKHRQKIGEIVWASLNTGFEVLNMSIPGIGTLSLLLSAIARGAVVGLTERELGEGGNE